MPEIVTVAFWAVVGIVATVYKIAKWVYDTIIKPLTYIKNLLDDMRKIVSGVIDIIRGKIDYVLELTGVDILLDLAHSVAWFAKHAKTVADGGKRALLLAFTGVYEAMAGMAKDIITIMSVVMTPVFDRLAILKADIKTITEFKLKDLTKNYEDLVEEIKAMPEKLMADVNAEIKAESERIKEGFRGDLAVVDVRLTGVIALSEDLKHFSEMFLKAMET